MQSRFICILAALSASVSVYAADFKAEYYGAFTDFEKRGQSTDYARSCTQKALAAFKSAANDVEKYDALVLQSRCTYFLGMKAGSDDEKIKIFGEAKGIAEQAKAFQKDRAEAYFFYGISLGRWAEANGIMKSLGERHNLRRNMETVLGKSAIDKVTVRNDQNVVVEVKDVPMPGKEYDAWGANRTLGRMYFKLPGMFGGDNQKAERYLREAFEKSPSQYPNALNVHYLAEVLVANDKKAEARKILDDLLRYENEPARYNARRAPETSDEMKDARKLRNELGN